MTPPSIDMIETLEEAEDEESGEQIEYSDEYAVSVKEVYDEDEKIVGIAITLYCCLLPFNREESSDDLGPV